MPARLISAPRAYVYTKDQSGTVHNFSTYVVSGQVQRKLDQVSSAEVVLRNPGKRFTTPSKGVAFHPMDPITIYLERIQGYPVRVFTGYLDTTPYYQMFPGTITLKASCTLKRLLYTYFDPSLPYVIAFFTKYGWINTGQGSIISNQAFNNNATTQAAVDAGQLPFSSTRLQDGSLGKLLWAILYDIGEWQDSNIYVENLPSGADGLAARMAKLMSSLQASQKEASSDFTTFLDNIIGAGSQGAGGGPGNSPGSTGQSSGPVAGAKAIVQTVQPIANKYNVPLEMVLAVMYIETNFNDKDSPGNPHFGWFQVQTANPPYAYGTWSHTTPTVTQAHDLGLSATAFCSAAAGWVSNDPSLRQNIQQWAMDTQGVTGQNNPRYITAWPTATSTANSMIAQYGQTTATGQASTTNSTTQSGSTAPSNNAGLGNTSAVTGPTPPGGDARQASNGGASGVALQALHRQQKESCFNYSQRRPIQYGILTDKTVNIDCSGFAIACYKAAGWGDPSHNNYNGQGFTGDMIPHAKRMSDASAAQPGDLCFFGSSESATEHVNIYVGNGQAISMGQQGDPSIGPAAQMGPAGFLGYYRPDTAGVGVSVTGGATGGGATGDVTGASTAQAFVAELQFPSVEDQVTAIALGSEHKGLMHDQSLMPFVQQVCQASMRSFQSLPSGDFYAFYPDYFGEFGHHKPYWFIRDIEILDGGINLSDDALATHVFAVGDNTWPVNQELLNMLFSAGTVNVFNAFVGNGIIDTSKPTVQKGEGLAPGIMNADEAVKFIQRYGARPLVQNYPMVRSPIYEMLLAYQQFMMAWSNQFKTPFTFTFMPELFPGGKVGFPDHGLQMFINSVTHEWNYGEGGFTTTAELTAPSLLQGVDAADFPDIPPQMVSALIEPLRKNPPGSAAPQKKAPPTTTNTITDPNVPGAITNPLSPFPVTGTSPFGNNIW